MTAHTIQPRMNTVNKQSVCILAIKKHPMIVYGVFESAIISHVLHEAPTQVLEARRFAFFRDISMPRS
jgi:hypothetical protein